MKGFLTLTTLVVAASLLTLSGCTRRVVVYKEAPPPQHVVVVQPAPPPLQVEVVGVAPYPYAVWVKGHWDWRPRSGKYVWVPGHWVRR